MSEFLFQVVPLALGLSITTVTIGVLVRFMVVGFYLKIRENRKSASEYAENKDTTHSETARQHETALYERVGFKTIDEWWVSYQYKMYVRHALDSRLYRVVKVQPNNKTILELTGFGTIDEWWESYDYRENVKQEEAAREKLEQVDMGID